MSHSTVPPPVNPNEAAWANLHLFPKKPLKAKNKQDTKKHHSSFGMLSYLGDEPSGFGVVEDAGQITFEVSVRDLPRNWRGTVAEAFARGSVCQSRPCGLCPIGCVSELFSA